MCEVYTCLDFGGRMQNMWFLVIPTCSDYINLLELISSLSSSSSFTSIPDLATVETLSNNNNILSCLLNLSNTKGKLLLHE